MPRGRRELVAARSWWSVTFDLKGIWRDSDRRSGEAGYHRGGPERPLSAEGYNGLSVFLAVALP